MRRTAVAGPVLVSLAIALASPDASAQDTGAAAAATQLFDEGVAAMEKGRFAEACPKLAKSEELSPNGGTLLALADCYDKNGQFASAWVAYKDVADRAAAAHKPDAEKNALDAAKRLEPKISRLTVTVPTTIDGLVVKRDGKPVNPAEIGVPVPLDPGQHTIDASAPGRKPFSTRVVFGNTGAQKSLAVPELEAEATAAADGAPPPPPEGSPGKAQRIVGLAVGGVGIVGLALGTVFGLQAKSKNDDASAACPDPSHCSQAGIDLDKKARDAATISTIGFIAGGALLAGGAVLFFTAPRGGAPAEPAASVGVRATPGGAAMTFGATF